MRRGAMRRRPYIRAAALLTSMCAIPSGTALASEGPWTTAPGLHNLYVGLYHERFACFTQEGAGDDGCGADAAPVSSPVNQTGLKAFYRTGLTRNIDVALGLPVARSSSESMPTTLGWGTVQARLRWQLGDLGPVSVATGVGLETGALHRASRGRITNLGDGTTGATGSLYMGSMGVLGPRFYTASADVSYAYRLTELTDNDVRLPADELRFSSVFLYALSQRVGVGLSLDGQFRLWGEELDFSELASYGGADDSMRWAVLNASQMKGGARLALYSTDRLPYLQLTVLRALWADHNPTDTTMVEAAVGFDLGRRQDDR